MPACYQRWARGSVAMAARIAAAVLCAELLIVAIAWRLL